MDRIEFIKNCGLFCLGSAVMATSMQSCSSTNYFAKSSLIQNQIVIAKSEFQSVQNEKIVERKYVLVRNEKFNYPIGLYKLSEENYSALLLQCTHKGCELRPSGSFLVCPCHGSEFSNTGIVQNPPAEQNLQTFKISTDDENIYIQI